MILTERIITVNGNISTLDAPIYLYQGDKNVDIYFSIVNPKYKFSKKVVDNLLGETAAYFDLYIIKPDGSQVSFKNQAIEDKKAKWTIESELIDEEIEIGKYDFQIRLLDENKTSILTIPPLLGQLEILKPIYTDSDTPSNNLVNLAATNYALATSGNNDVVVFDEDGNYVATVWTDKMKITDTLLNKIETAIKQNTAQYKDIANYSLIKHTDGKVYIKKQDGTLIGDGIEIGGSDVDLSKITMSMSGQTLKLMNDGNQIATVEIPTAVVTDEQLTSIIQSKIDDGTLSAMTIENGSITPNKTDFLNKGNNTTIINTNFTKYYDTEYGYFAGQGSYGTDLIDISKASKIKAYCGKNYVCWLSYNIGNKKTLMTLDKDDYPYLFFEESIQLEDGNYLFEYDLNTLKKLGVTEIALGFYGKEFNKDLIQIKLINENILNKKELSIAPSYEFKISNDNIDNVSIDFEKINIYKSNKIIDFRKKKRTGFNTKLAGIYGSNKNLYGGFVDVSINKTIYSKYAISNKVSINYIPFSFGCYDADKNLLYLSSGFSAEGVKDNTGVIGTPIASTYTMNGLENATEETVYCMCIQKITFPEEVKYVVFSNSVSYAFASYQSFDSKYFCIGFELIDDLYLTNDKYYNGINPTLKNIISEIAQIKNTENKEPKRLACIGDSLTNWGGGDDSNNGFLKPIYEKLGINITNLGRAGETWEISKPSDGSTADIKNVTGTSAIGRVNKIVADNIGYDYILFFMGANTKDNGTLQSLSTDPYTMCGAMKYCLETIMRTFPKTIIGVILPPMRVEDSHNIEGKSTMETKGEMMKTIANYYSVPVFDTYHESQIVAGNVVVVDGKPNGGNGSLSDGLHLGEIGIYHLGRKLSNWVSML